MASAGEVGQAEPAHDRIEGATEVADVPGIERLERGTRVVLPRQLQHVRGQVGAQDPKVRALLQHVVSDVARATAEFQHFGISRFDRIAEPVERSVVQRGVHQRFIIPLRPGVEDTDGDGVVVHVKDLALSVETVRSGDPGRRPAAELASQPRHGQVGHHQVQCDEPRRSGDHDGRQDATEQMQATDHQRTGHAV
jgi:hypothetical protein